MTVISDRSVEPQLSSLPDRDPGTSLRTALKRTKKPLIKRLGSEAGLLFFTTLALYLFVGLLLDFRYMSFNGDAASRMANGFYVLYSGDPHLAAIGFVWNPGTSVADIVPLLFYHLWTPLGTHMFAASLVSSVCMAGAVYQVWSTLNEWGVSRVPRLFLSAVLALNAMIVYYGGNGMSEGLYLFTLLATCRYLLRWLRDDDMASLIYSASFLGACYLTRNEAVGPAFAAGACVVAVSFLKRSSSRLERNSVPRSRRVWAALTDLTIFEFPFVVAFAGWAVASYIITGSPFEQFTSVYGNTSQEKLLTHLGFHARIATDVHNVGYLAPTILVVLIVAVVVGLRRRDIGFLAPVSVVGAALAFDLLSYAANTIQPFFRYFIAAVPLNVLLVGGLFATAPALVGSVPSKAIPSGTARYAKSLISVVVVLLLLAPGAYTTIKGMQNPKVGVEESEFLGYIVHKQHLTALDKSGRAAYPAMLKITDYLAKLHLANGQVVVDNFNLCIPSIITMSPNPDIFVIPNDRDFQKVLNDPLRFKAGYILDASPTGAGALTAPNTIFPTLWKTGGGFAKAVHTFPADGFCQEFKLFRVTGHPNQDF